MTMPPPGQPDPESAPPPVAFGDPPHNQTIPPRQGMPWWGKLLLWMFGIGAGLLILLCAGLIWFGTVTPDTFVVSGRQLDSDYTQTIRDLNLIDDDEEIVHFYSDGLLKVTEGMYFYTDEQVVMYSTAFDDPYIAATWDEIADITVEYDDSFLVDSTIRIDLHDGSSFFFPVSSEGGGDRRFYDGLVKRWNSARPADN